MSTFFIFECTQRKIKFVMSRSPTWECAHNDPTAKIFCYNIEYSSGLPCVTKRADHWYDGLRLPIMNRRPQLW